MTARTVVVSPLSGLQVGKCRRNARQEDQIPPLRSYRRHIDEQNAEVQGSMLLVVK